MKKKEYWLSLLTVLIAVSDIIGPMPNAGSLFYSLWMAGLLLFYILTGGRLSIDFLMLTIIIVAVFSTLINQPPSFFRSWERLGQFVIIAGVVSPLVQNAKLLQFRKDLFQWMLKVSVVITIISFIGYFLGINYVYSSTDEIGRAHV